MTSADLRDSQSQIAVDVSSLFPNGWNDAILAIEIRIQGVFRLKREVALFPADGPPVSNHLTLEGAIDFRVPEIAGRVVAENFSAIHGAAVGLIGEADFRAVELRLSTEPIYPLQSTFSDKNGDFKLCAPKPGRYHVVAAQNSSIFQAEPSPSLSPVEIPIEFSFGDEILTKTIVVPNEPAVHGACVGFLAPNPPKRLIFKISDIVFDSYISMAGTELSINSGHKLFVRSVNAAVDSNGTFVVAGLLEDGLYAVRACGDDILTPFSSVLDDVSNPRIHESEVVMADLREPVTVRPDHKRRLEITLSHATLRLTSAANVETQSSSVEIFRDGELMWSGSIARVALFDVDVGASYVIKYWRNSVFREIRVRADRAAEIVEVVLGSR